MIASRVCETLANGETNECVELNENTTDHSDASADAVQDEIKLTAAKKIVEFQKSPSYKVINRQGVTCDVQTGPEVTFQSLGISEAVLKGIEAVGYASPSPIQAEGIPKGLAGQDLVLKSKAGTGKTLVFTVVALETLNNDLDSGVQVLMLAPSSEICIQIYHTVLEIGQFVPNLVCRYAVGGTNYVQDKKYLSDAQIVIGTIGRVCQLIKEKVLSLDLVKLFIVDEVDKMKEGTMLEAFNWVYNHLRPTKQIITASATYPCNISTAILPYMTNVAVIRLNTTDCQLLGVKCYVVVNSFRGFNTMLSKMAMLVHLLKSVQFDQCVVFSNWIARVEDVAKELNKHGIPAVSFAASMPLAKRVEILTEIKERKIRIIVATDLLCRGVDFPGVDLVINYDLPESFITFLHRTGRSGRFGTESASVTLLCCKADAMSFLTLAKAHNMHLKILDAGAVPIDLSTNKEVFNEADKFCTEKLPAARLWPLLLKYNQNVGDASRIEKEKEIAPRPSHGKAAQQGNLKCFLKKSDDEKNEVIISFCNRHSRSNGVEDAEHCIYSAATFKSVLDNFLVNGFPKIDLSSDALKIMTKKPIELITQEVEKTEEKLPVNEAVKADAVQVENVSKIQLTEVSEEAVGHAGETKDVVPPMLGDNVINEEAAEANDAVGAEVVLPEHTTAVQLADEIQNNGGDVQGLGDAYSPSQLGDNVPSEETAEPHDQESDAVNECSCGKKKLQVLTRYEKILDRYERLLDQWEDDNFESEESNQVNDWSENNSNLLTVLALYLTQVIETRGHL